MSVTFGVDLASQAIKTAICLIAWDAQDAPRVIALARGTNDGADLHDKLLSTASRGLRRLGPIDAGPPTKVAIDAPFGWPDPFVQALALHHRGDPWPLDLDHDRSAYERRLTDRRVWQRVKKAPLSVTTDRIAYPAMRCAVILGDLSRHLTPEAVRRDGSGLVAEAYPDAALRCWAPEVMPTGSGSSYKGDGAEAVERRTTILARVLEEVPLRLDPAHKQLVASSDDALDALICALVARAVELGLTSLPETDEEHDLALREGWIHLPRPEASLSALLR